MINHMIHYNRVKHLPTDRISNQLISGSNFSFGQVMVTDLIS